MRQVKGDANQRALSRLRDVKRLYSTQKNENMEKLSGSAKRNLKKEKDIRNAEHLKYIPKIGNFFTTVSVTNYSAKASSVNEDSSDSQDIYSLPALANVHSPESEEPTDLDGSSSDELIQFKHFVQNETSPVQLLASS